MRKVYCEKCNEEITLYSDSRIDAYRVGRVQCPHCQKIQSRYISEADLLIYYGMSEVAYVIVTLITFCCFRFIGFSFWLFGVLLILLVFYFFVQKQISRFVYLEAPLKKEIKNTEFKEDEESIRRNLQWQFLLFFAVAITFATNTVNLYFSLFFGFLLLVSLILTFIKIRLALKKEKEKGKIIKKVR